MTKEEVIKLANKLNMNLDDRTIEDIIAKDEFFNKELNDLQVFDTIGVAPMDRVDETETSFLREDVEGEVLPVKVIIDNAAETQGNFVSLKKVVK